jgi:predicted dehydrogenase
MSERTRLAVALIGCGRIAHVHQQYLAGIPEAELVAVCDADAQARSTMSQRAAVPAYGSVEELLRCAAPQVVHVLTPPSTHAPLALEALEAGAHVFIEKPMALRTADADALVATARRRGLVVTADHNRWFDPVVRRARAMLEQGALGTLVAVDIFQGGGAGDVETQLWKRALPGGSMHDVAPHPAYFLRHFLGSLETVKVVAEQDDAGGIEEARVAARGARGLGTITLSMRGRPAVNWVRLFGSQATVEINLNHMTLVVYREYRGSKLLTKVLPNLTVASQLLRETIRNGIDFVGGRQRFYPGIGAHLREFYRCMAGGQPPPVLDEEARDVVALCERILSNREEVRGVRAVGT